MVGLMVLVEAFVAHRSLDFLDMDDWAYRKNARAAERDAKRYDIICFGDSLVKLTVVPRAVEARSGLRTLNLAVSGSQAPASYALLKRTLEAGARPAGVVVDFQPPLLRLWPRHNLNRWADLLTFVEAAQLAHWAHDPDLFTTFALGRLLPSFHRRDAVRTNVKFALTGTGANHRWFNFLAFRNWSRNGGAQLAAPTPGLGDLTDKQVDDIRRGFYPRWECHPANLEGLRRFLELAAAHGVTVYWLLTPHLPAMHRKMAESGIDAQHEAFLRSWQARFPNVVVVDGRGKVSDPGAFYDANHLAARGAYAFSLGLGDALRHARAGVPPSRWVTVADCRIVPLPEGYEDILQSHAALASAGEAQR
jgi:hypothetical protein